MLSIDKKNNAIRKFRGFFNQQLKSCRLCPRNCGVNRGKEKGYCDSSLGPVIYNYFLHKGEEPPISGINGSGTIFFSGCSLRCAYCQNFPFSQRGKGKELTSVQLAQIMLELQEKGAVNINLVTPTHFLPAILEALSIALNKGLCIPIVYNSSGYETKEVLRRLSGIIDVYLLDIKYFTVGLARKLSRAPDYAKFNQQAIFEAYRQQPQVIINKAGIIESGVILRHLILPGYTNESKQILTWVKRNLAQYEPFVSIMSQFQPFYRAKQAGVGRSLNLTEYEEVQTHLHQLSITNGWFQDYSPDKKLAGVYFDSRYQDSG